MLVNICGWNQLRFYIDPLSFGIVALYLSAVIVAPHHLMNNLVSCRIGSTFVSFQTNPDDRAVQPDGHRFQCEEGTFTPQRLPGHHL